MTPDAATLEWRDPWPSPELPWCDPPWLMRGRAATAWFEVPWEVAAASLSPDLLPEQSAKVRARLRFYDLAFTAPDAAEGPLVPREGRFREGVVAFAARGGGLEGEVSLFLWTESETYLMWGREAFGWPVRLADVNLEGSLWKDDQLLGASGSARLRDGWGSASLLDVEVTEPATSGTPSGYWLTPRRVLHAAGCDGETRELLVVRPATNDPGTGYSGSGRVRFDFPAAHPLHSLGEFDARVEVADGFELLIGGDVEVLPR